MSKPAQPAYVQEALRGLTKAERRHVLNGYVGDPFTMTTVRSLRRKALFFIMIDSPNGRCGFLKLTPLGETVRKILKERIAARGAKP